VYNGTIQNYEYGQALCTCTALFLCPFLRPMLSGRFFIPKIGYPVPKGAEYIFLFYFKEDKQ